MRFRLFILIVLLGCVSSVAGQNPQGESINPLTQISSDLSKISKSVQTLSDRLKSFVDKFENAPGTTMSEKQQRLIVGLQILASAEEILAARQKYQIELVEKQGTTRTRLAQVERDVTPHGIDRSVAFEGTTKTEELRENRRSALVSERASLQALLSQINSSLADANDSVREAQQLVIRLRRLYIPQIEREIADQ